MEYLVMGGQLFLSLSILIVLHELGHFVPAKLFGTRVSKFYLFFDFLFPFPNIANFSLFKFTYGGTEYGIGWFPMGGYVNIEGMIDENYDKDAMSGPPQPWEFRSKPAWQRLIVMLGGVIVNFVLGFFLYGMVLWTWGEEFLPAENASYGIHADSLGLELGLEHGDQIVSVGGQPFEHFSDRFLVREIVINSADKITVRRAGQTVNIPVEDKWINILSDSQNASGLFIPRMPMVIEAAPKGQPAGDAGLLKEDQIIELNGAPISYYDRFISTAKPLAGQQVEIAVLRNADTVRTSLKMTDRSTIGIVLKPFSNFFEMERKEYTLLQALPAGVREGVKFLNVQFKAFGQMFRGKIKASNSLGGFGSIGKMFGSTWDWEHFWRMSAILSLILAFMNLLPIPALDGGHAMFILYEMISGRKPSDKFMEYSMTAGLFILFGLLIYANGLDVLRAFGWA